MATLHSLKQNYLEMCKDVTQLPNPYIVHVLQEVYQQPVENHSDGIMLKLAGNNHLTPVQKITDDDVMVLAKILYNNTFVTGLDLRYNSLTDTGAEHIGILLRETPSLRHLNLMCNDIATKGAEFLTKALLDNETLKQLRINGNKIGNKGGMHFASMLQINATLEELDLGDTDLGTQSLIALATVLTHNSTIKSINLSRPLLYDLQEETTVHMTKMLKVNPSLKELHLGKHEMTDFGVERLCETLLVNSSLRYLDLQCNKITRDGAKHLAELLKKNTAIEILDLASNRIEDDGAVYLSEAIALHNNRLKGLAVVSNNIGAKGLVALAEAMKTNTTLSYIYIWGNKLTDAPCKAFADLLASGRLEENHTDVRPYVVDDHFYVAELFHGLRRNYYWTPSFGKDGDFICNSSLAVMGTS
ncbi:leucine-rich repeat-containing protein 34 isoform X1 [Protopterus annectens]|uniref:leucine-rich repeat-containing protein 34 isoform X1 n=1 Tax=Protopterus annectens TaxID=7888 RepID=UPI001CFBB27C|nr:leucine-rich repeat-containing protein 34 isoform X1 [Protopterus annectens]